ncbi:MAG: hypothetical protein ACR2HF_04685 [Methylococcaceae bacterium]
MERRVYSSGENRHKHHWDKPEAGFISQGSMYIGKCPTHLTRNQAQILLDTGIPYPENNPKRIYNVYQGVIYEAVSANDGTWHGYPWRFLPGRNVLPRLVKKTLRNRAIDAGEAKAFDQWIKEYG